MSDTPRTDEYEFDIGIDNCRTVVDVEFARELEAELQEAKYMLEDAIPEVNDFQKGRIKKFLEKGENEQS